MKLFASPLGLAAWIALSSLALPSTCRKAAERVVSAGAAEQGVIVAAIQAGFDEPHVVHADCTTHQCAAERLITRAAEQGAKLVVTPESWIDDGEPEPEPALGERPDIDHRRPLGSSIALFSSLANRLQIYLVVHLDTRQSWHAVETQHSSLIAFAPDGRVVGKHHKFELFQGEQEILQPGQNAMVFDTPFGKVGMLICADIYGDPRRHDELTRELGAQIIAFSTLWLSDRAAHFQSAFASDWNVYLVAANSAGGTGSGGGIYDPTGKALASAEGDDTGVVIASIPVQLPH